MKKDMKIDDITSKEVEEGFISPQMIALEERYHNDSKFAEEEVDRQAYADLYDILYTNK